MRSGAEFSQLLPLTLVCQLALKVEDFNCAALPSQLLDLLDAPDGPVYCPVIACGKHDAARTLANRLPIQGETWADEGSLTLGGGVLLEILQGTSAHGVNGVGIDGEPFLAVVFELIGVDLGIGLFQGAVGLVLLAGLLVCEDRPREEPVEGLC